MSSISIPRGIDENLARVLREITQQLEKAQSITDKFSIESDERGKPRVLVTTSVGKASIGATVEERGNEDIQSRDIDAKKKDILNVRRIKCDEMEVSNETLYVGPHCKLYTDGQGIWVRTPVDNFKLSSVTSDHGDLDGLADNDHPQYSLTSHDHDHGTLTGLSDNDHPQYSLTSHDHDHGTLTGLSDDDHPQYALAGAATASRLTLAAAEKLLGRGSGGGAGAVQEIGAGFGLSIASTTLTNTQPRSFPAQPCGYLAGVYYDFSQNAAGGATRAIVADQLYLWPAFVNWDVTPLEFGVSVQSAAASGKSMRVVIYDSSATGFPNLKLWESASFLVDSTGYKRNSTGLTLKLDAGTLYWIGVWSDGAPTLYGYPTSGTLSLGLQSSSSSSYYGTIRRAYTAFSGTLASPFVMTSADLNTAQNAASVRFLV